MKVSRIALMVINVIFLLIAVIGIGLILNGNVHSNQAQVSVGIILMMVSLIALIQFLVFVVMFGQKE
jgi:hypothetical protein